MAVVWFAVYLVKQFVKVCNTMLTSSGVSMLQPSLRMDCNIPRKAFVEEAPLLVFPNPLLPPSLTLQCMEPLLNSHWYSSSPLSSSCLPDLKELLRDKVGAAYLCFTHFEMVRFQGCLRTGVPVRAILHPLCNWECLCPQPALGGRIMLIVLNLHYVGGF